MTTFIVSKISTGPDTAGTKIHFGPLFAQVTQSSWKLCIIFANHLKLDKDIKTVIQSCCPQLKDLAKISSFLSRRNLETDIHAFISSCSDYCNALYTSLSKQSLYKLQLVQMPQPDV